MMYALIAVLFILNFPGWNWTDWKVTMNGWEPSQSIFIWLSSIFTESLSFSKRRAKKGEHQTDSLKWKEISSVTWQSQKKNSKNHYMNSCTVSFQKNPDKKNSIIFNLLIENYSWRDSTAFKTWPSE